ncbi:MAG TPA: (Fe-S)-binding protein [Gammaproteobacteria bacterium]
MDKKSQHTTLPELKDTDLCVFCGMCLPHCPTYSVYQNEAESPRGRISLIQAYARGMLEIDSRAYEHLDHCLGCMACEAMCPSKVPYGRLLNQAKSILHPGSSSFILNRILEANTKQNGVDRFRFISSLLNKTGLISIAGKLPGKQIRAASQIISSCNPVKLDSIYTAQEPVGSILLFTGCMSQSYDGQALEDSIKLLNYYGFNVHVPQDQYCCGAMHSHNGQADKASELETKNRELFEKTSADTVIYTSNGCGAHLRSYASSFKTIDVASFLIQNTRIQSSDFMPMEDSIMVHESCSSQNKLKISGISRQLLQHIPNMNLLAFQKPNLCCGAGGGHLVSYPELANELLADKLSQLQSSSVKYLVSDNLGCSLHYKSGLAKMGLKIEVIHPVTLLAMQLKTKTKE